MLLPSTQFVFDQSGMWDGAKHALGLRSKRDQNDVSFGPFFWWLHSYAQLCSAMLSYALVPSDGDF